MNCQLEVYVNSFQQVSLEATHSRRLLYILESKAHLLPVKVVDVNQELANFLREKGEGAEANNLRQQLQEKYGLISNGSQGEVCFPQVFLCVSEQPKRSVRASFAPASKKKTSSDFKSQKEPEEASFQLALESVKNGDELGVTRTFCQPITEVFDEDSESFGLSFMKESFDHQLKPQIQKHYLGDYLAVQYLEDSGLFD